MTRLITNYNTAIEQAANPARLANAGKDAILALAMIAQGAHDACWPQNNPSVVNLAARGDAGREIGRTAISLLGARLREAHVLTSEASSNAILPLSWAGGSGLAGAVSPAVAGAYRRRAVIPSFQEALMMTVDTQFRLVATSRTPRVRGDWASDSPRSAEMIAITTAINRALDDLFRTSAATDIAAYEGHPLSQGTLGELAALGVRTVRSAPPRIGDYMTGVIAQVHFSSADLALEGDCAATRVTVRLHMEFLGQQRTIGRTSTRPPGACLLPLLWADAPFRNGTSIDMTTLYKPTAWVFGAGGLGFQPPDNPEVETPGTQLGLGEGVVQ